MGEAENVKIVQKLYADYGQGNIPAVVDALGDEIVFIQPKAGQSPLAGTYRGRKQVEDWFKKLDETSEEQDFEPREFIAQGDAVVVLGHYKFRAKSTGKTWESDWVMVWKVREGKLVSFQFYGDTAAEAAAFS